MLAETKKDLELTGIGKAQFGKSVVIKICLGADQDARREVHIALGVIRFSLRTMDVPPGMTQWKVSKSLALLFACVLRFGMLQCPEIAPYSVYVTRGKYCNRMGELWMVAALKRTVRLSP